MGTTIEAIVGTIGSGKTLFLTWKTLMNFLNGDHIVSNYNLKGIPYTPFTKVKDLYALKGNSIYLAGDEFWVNLDARAGYTNANKARKIIKQTLQSRKKKISIGYTLQHFSQADRRLRNITSRLYYPQITAWTKDKVPLILRVKYFDLINPAHVMTMNVPLIVPGVYNVPQMYDTFEIVEEAEDTEETENLETLVERYMDSEYDNIGELKTIVLMTERLKHGNQWITDSQGLNVARWIHFLRKKK